jgi:hypothetical protein
MAWAWVRTNGATEKPITGSCLTQTGECLPSDAASLPRGYDHHNYTDNGLEVKSQSGTIGAGSPGVSCTECGGAV